MNPRYAKHGSAFPASEDAGREGGGFGEGRGRNSMVVQDDPEIYLDIKYQSMQRIR